MKVLSAIAVSALLLQHPSPPPNPAARGVHPAVRPGATIHLPDTSTGSAFSDLLALGLHNHLPIGIVVGDGPDLNICRTPLRFTQGTMTVAELIGAIEVAVPGYQAEIQNGVLDLTPNEPSDNTARFLAMRLTHFEIAPQAHQEMGYMLWGAVYGLLAPSAGRNLSHLRSMSAETVPGIDVSNASVKSILNKIVDEGNGGVWVLRTSPLKTLSADTGNPIEVHGYVGEETLFADPQMIPCVEPSTQ
jgi:hypothetical protein